MSEVSTLPDLEAVASTVLRGEDICEGRVYSVIPNEPTYPLAIVERLGGVPAIREKLDRGRIQVSVYGASSQSEAADEAEAARRALHGAEATVFGDLDAYVTAVADDMGLFRLTDPTSKRPTYKFTVLIYAHAYNGPSI
jgi:hypothetical protein